MPAYFDTNVIRYLRTGLNGPLPANLQNKIVLSPVSAIEVISQIADEGTGEEALRSIHRFRDWLPEQAVLLDWLESFYARVVFGMEIEDQIFPLVTQMLDRALAANNLSPQLCNGARALRQMNEQAKLRKAGLFQQAADRLRAENLPLAELNTRIRREITFGIARRINADEGTRTQDQIEASLPAYFEFHRRSVLAAVRNLAFRFDSRAHLNDHFDGEQLLYLAAPENQFFTSDAGFNCVTQTSQGPRLHILSAIVLSDPGTAHAALQSVITGCSTARTAASRGT